MPKDLPDTTTLEFDDNRVLVALIGPNGANLIRIEQAAEVQITQRGNQLMIFSKDDDARALAAQALGQLYERAAQGKELEPGEIDAAIRMPAAFDDKTRATDQIEMFKGDDRLEIRTRKKIVEPRTESQKGYVNSLFDNELVFGLGPAGTGKTYLAVAVAVAHFIDGHVDRIILSRPAVEAGERLGFLPGDMKEKVDPYMQPLYDALHDFLPGRQLGKLIEEKQIEIAPLAFMRGRTLANSFVVLDEAQNATTMQMKMFLTRLGEGSRMAITGDTSQIDLPKGVTSGLVEAERILRDVKGIGFARFTATDVVRHPMVAKIIRAYDKAAQRDE